MATPNYAINYDDKRFTEVESDKKEALNEVEKTYGGMINNSDKFYQAQIDNTTKWENTQKNLQNQQTDFIIDEIEQKKEYAEKDYKKEQSGAYVDWQKQSNPYGAKAEQMAAGGFTGSGYSESSQVAMYNQYQNRVATAREAYVRIIADYDNDITNARIQNNVALAEIANAAQEKRLALSIEGFQYKNQLIIDKFNKKTEVDDRFYGRYQDVVQQINNENSLAESVRQYNERLAEDKRQYNESLAFQKDQAAKDQAYKDSQLALQREQFNWQKSQAAKSSGSGSVKKPSGSSDSNNSSINKDSGGNSSIKPTKSVPKNTYANAVKYLEALIASGASKETVEQEIAIALQEGAITAIEAVKLRGDFTPRGAQY